MEPQANPEPAGFCGLEKNGHLVQAYHEFCIPGTEKQSPHFFSMPLVVSFQKYYLQTWQDL